MKATSKREGLSGWLQWGAVFVAGMAVAIVFLLSYVASGWLKVLISKRVPPIPNLSGEVAIVTGANSGIGFVTARELCLNGATVVVTARSESKGLDAVKRICASSSGPCRAHFIALDLNSFKSVRQFTETFRAKYNRLDMLILNAGVFQIPYQNTEDGYEMHIQANLLGHFLLTKRLMSMITHSKTRVVTVSAKLHKDAGKKGIDFSTFKYDPNGAKSYNKVVAYGQATLGKILFSQELARRLEGTGATSVSLHPGIITTEGFKSHWDETLYSISTFGEYVFSFLIAAASMDSNQGARTQLYLATSPEMRKVTGRYYEPMGEDKTSSVAFVNDAAYLKQMWEECDRLVGS